MKTLIGALLSLFLVAPAQAQDIPSWQYEFLYQLQDSKLTIAANCERDKRYGEADINAACHHYLSTVGDRIAVVKAHLESGGTNHWGVMQALEEEGRHQKAIGQAYETEGY